MPSSFERVAHQAPLAMGFSRQEYWSGLPFPSPGDLPDSGTELRSPALQADSTIWATRESPWMRNPGTFNLNAIATRSLKRLQSKKKKKRLQSTWTASVVLCDATGENSFSSSFMLLSEFSILLAVGKRSPSASCHKEPHLEQLTCGRQLASLRV